MAVSEESKLFRFTLKHSLFLCAVMGFLVLFYTYVAPDWALQPLGSRRESGPRIYKTNPPLRSRPGTNSTGVWVAVGTDAPFTKRTQARPFTVFPARFPTSSQAPAEHARSVRWLAGL
jgi:hypothetical protein